MTLLSALKIKIHNHHTPPYCGECPMFLHEDTDGRGFCGIQAQVTDVSFPCYLTYRHPTLKETERLLHHLQKYRRGKGKMLSPYLIGVAIDEAIRTIRGQKKRNKQKNL